MVQTRQELEGTWQAVTDNASLLVKEIRQTIEELSVGVGENMVKALDTFDGKVAEVVERFSGTLFEAGQTIGEMPVLITSLDEQLKGVNAGIEDQKKILAELNNTTRNMVGDNIEKACEASDRLVSCSEKMSDTTGEIQQFFDTFLDKAKGNAENFGQSNREAIDQLGRLFDDMTLEMRQASDFVNAASPIKELVDTLQKVESKIQTSSSSSENVLDGPLKSMVSNIEEMKKVVVDRVNNGYKETTQNLLERATTINQQMENLTIRVNELSPDFKKVSDVVGKISQTLESIENQAENAKEQNPEKRTFWGIRRK